VTGTTTLLARLSSSHTANRFALEIWSTFVTGVVRAIDRAGHSLAQPTVHAVHAGKAGWWLNRERRNLAGELVRVPSEDAITSALVAQLEDLRRSSGPGDPLFDLNIVFASQQPRRTQTRTGSLELTTDIRAHVPDNETLDLRIEAKVLFDEGDLSRQYLTHRGLLRFADDANPYSDTIVGAMLGYAVCPHPDGWSETIGAALATVGPASLVNHVGLAGRAEPVLTCDITSPAVGRKVTVLHLLIRQLTDPSSWSNESM
jgi:hypothetical protein